MTEEQEQKAAHTLKPEAEGEESEEQGRPDEGEEDRRQPEAEGEAQKSRDARTEEKKTAAPARKAAHILK
jgi:hypothetical protein